MKVAESSGHAMDTHLVTDHEREFFVVWKALTRIWVSAPHDDLLRLETQRAADTVLYLMRSADCIDPSLSLDGTRLLHAGAAEIH
jgi:hypothetical protein